MVENESCQRCGRVPHAASLRRVYLPDSRRSQRRLCLVCWGDLVVWLKRPPSRRALAVAPRVRPVLH